MHNIFKYIEYLSHVSKNRFYKKYAYENFSVHKQCSGYHL